MPWCLPAIEASGQAHPRSQDLLLGQGSTECLLVTLRCTLQSLTLILHVLGPVSSAWPSIASWLQNSLLFILLHFTFTQNTLCVSSCFRFTSHAYQYASTPLATSAPLGCLHSYNPHPQCLACTFATLTHSLPGSRPGRKLPLLASGTLFGFSYHETAPAEDHPAGSQCKFWKTILIWTLDVFFPLLNFIN